MKNAISPERDLPIDRDPLFPSPPQVALLRAVFGSPNGFLSAWHLWAEQQDSHSVDAASDQLLALLVPRIRDHGVQGSLADHCRQLYRVNRIGNTILFHKLKTLLSALRLAGVEVMLLKGAALIPMYYRDYGLRPMNDLDLAVRPGQFDRAAAALCSLGWRPAQQLSTFDSRFAHSLGFEGPTGVCVDLHCHPIAQCLRESLDASLWQRAIFTEFGNEHFLRLCSEDQIVQIIAHGMRRVSPPPIRWVADTMQIVRSQDRLDWSALAAHSDALEISGTIRPCLRYLNQTFGLPLPDAFFDRTHKIFTAREIRLKRAVASDSSQTLLQSVRYHWAILCHVAGKKGAWGAMLLVPAYARSRRHAGRTMLGTIGRYIRRYFFPILGLHAGDPRPAAQ